jgi:hypothetical protein
MRIALWAGAVLIVASAARADTDIVWPTYAQATYPSDAALRCPQLHGAIDHVTSDLALLTQARDRVGDIIRNGFASDTTLGRQGDRQFHLAATRSGMEGYVKARDQIIASRVVAAARLEALNALLPATCKAAP